MEDIIKNNSAKSEDKNKLKFCILATVVRNKESMTKVIYSMIILVERYY